MQQVLLCTALVDIVDNKNRCFTIRALLDNGSQHSFISSELFKRLNIKSIQSTIRISGVGQSLTQSNERCEINIRSKTCDYSTRVQCMVLPCITSIIPSKPVDYKLLRIPDNIHLADPSFNEPSVIDLLIGADVFWDMLYESRIRLPSGPFLQNSKLGWLISGPVGSDYPRKNNQIQCNLTQTIDSNLKRFWELEEITSRNEIHTEDEHACEYLYETTTKRDIDGRFLVRIPLRKSADHLGESYSFAKSRFLSLERKLHRLPFYKKLYCDFIREYIELGHMTRVNEYNKPYYFLPHHGVLREHSTTTKLRVVFDASAVTTSNLSLNDIQYVGPPLQNDIPRLELCGALLGARLYTKITSSMRFQFNKVYFWTDSTIVMGWIRMSPHLLKTFVQHRVTEINELTGDSIWLHVNSKDNPADLVSRGVYLDMLIDCTLWWRGPLFLQDRQFDFKIDHSTYDSVLLPEVKNQIICASSSISNSLIDFLRFSSLKRLKRSSAYVIRFITNARSSKSLRKTGSLSVNELDAATNMLVRFAQSESFANEYDNLLKQLPIKGKGVSNKVSGLNIFLDKNDIIRIGGRLTNSHYFDYNKKHPILLSDPNDFLPLTPSHFLIGRLLTAPPCKDLTSTPTHRLIRYDRIEQMRQHFWQRWSKEYVAELQTRTKWKLHQPDIRLNTLVLIKEENLPPLKWRLGRITRTFPGKDGICRVAEILTATGIIHRATSKICPLLPQGTETN
ncbi:uncharacterized protein LOC131848314 [Achroia grisella]|uniref:uncharacterized protein LOC131848314 n=1 Tax=Achroia grisella TaxID=688607 RepID=UPI0027D2385F|nr:uncharacterized protein LOC131848314 [Achroia grisella]